MTATEIFDDAGVFRDASQIRMQAIIAAAAREFRISFHDITSAQQARRFSRPRQVAMYLGHRFAGKSLGQVGRSLGDRHHTTVLFGCHQISYLTMADPHFAERVCAVWFDAIQSQTTN